MCWMLQLNSSPTLVTTTTVWHNRCMINCTGSMFHSECSTSSQFWCTGVCRTKRQDTWSTAAFRSPTLPVDSTYVLPVPVTRLHRSTNEVHSEVGPFLLLVQRPGICCRMISMTHRVVAVVLGELWRQHFLLGTSELSTIEMLYKVDSCHWHLTLTWTASSL